MVRVNCAPSLSTPRSMVWATSDDAWYQFCTFTTADTGSITRRNATASSLRVTLSRVITCCGDTATATDEGGSPVAAAPATPADNGAAAPPADASTAPRTPPIDGYDSFTVAQLRGRLRGYALATVQELVHYEQATRNRAPYLTMLRNRLEKLEEQAIESSPLAPRGA